MTTGPIVIDASVVVPLVLGDGTTVALAGLADQPLHAPELLAAEFANALWKNVRAGATDRISADRHLAALDALPIRWHRDRMLVPAALRLANTIRHPVYDCLYLALALDLDAPVLTRDRRFAAAAEAAYPGRVRALG